MLLIVFTAPGNWLFATQAFPREVWGIITVLALCFGVLEEVRKRVVRHAAGRKVPEGSVIRMK